jgi:hypothetical protein
VNSGAENQTNICAAECYLLRMQQYFSVWVICYAIGATWCGMIALHVDRHIALGGEAMRRALELTVAWIVIASLCALTLVMGGWLDGAGDDDPIEEEWSPEPDAHVPVQAQHRPDSLAA